MEHFYISFADKGKQRTQNPGSEDGFLCVGRHSLVCLWQTFNHFLLISGCTFPSNEIIRDCLRHATHKIWTGKEVNEFTFTYLEPASSFYTSGNGSMLMKWYPQPQCCLDGPQLHLFPNRLPQFQCATSELCSMPFLHQKQNKTKN